MVMLPARGRAGVTRGQAHVRGPLCAMREGMALEEPRVLAQSRGVVGRSLCLPEPLAPLWAWRGFRAPGKCHQMWGGTLPRPGVRWVHQEKKCPLMCSLGCGRGLQGPCYGSFSFAALFFIFCIS